MNTLKITCFGLLFSLFVGSPTLAADAITTVELNQRAGPGTSFRVLQVIPAREPVIVIVCEDGSGWCEVDHFGLIGWVASRYLAFKIGRAPDRRYYARGSSVGIGFSSPGGVGIGFSTGTGYYPPY